MLHMSITQRETVTGMVENITHFVGIIISGDADFPNTLDDLDMYRREVAEQIIDLSSKLRDL